MWQAEGPETKGMYEARAEEKKAEHAALYPDYKFAPMKKEDKAMLRKAQRQEKEEIRQAERNRKKRKGKGRADDDEDEYDTRPYGLPYPLQRQTQSWYPPSTYGPQAAPPLQYPQHPSPPSRVPPPPLHDDQAAFTAAGWSTAVDPQGQAPDQDAPFQVDAYQQQPAEYEGEEEWAGEEGEWGAEEAWAGRTRRGAVWGEEQIAGPSEEQYQQQEEDPVSQWTSIPGSPPQQPQLLTVTLPATLNPSEQPYTFNLEFDVPMASFSGDPDANVAVSLGGMNLSESASTNPNVGLNDLLHAPLPDIAVSFPDFMGSADGQGNYDVLSTENEEWWSALMDAAIIPEDSRSYSESGPSRLMQQSMAGPSYESAGPSQPVAGPSHPVAPVSASRPAPIHTQSLPTFSHGLPSPDGEHHQGARSRAQSSAAYPGQMPGAFPEQSYQDAYQPQPAQPQPQQQYQQPYPQQQQEYNPSPFAQIASTRSSSGWRPQQQQRSRAPSFPAPPTQTQNNNFPYTHQHPHQFPSPSGANAFPSPSGGAQFPSPSGAGAFPSPSGANAFPSPSGTMSRPPHQPHQSFPRPPPARPPPPFFPPADKGKEKDPEAFDFSGWGSQYAAQPPTPAEDAVRRGVGVSH